MRRQIDGCRVSGGNTGNHPLLAVPVSFLPEQTAFVADSCVEDREKWLPLSAVLPVSLSATFIPVTLVIGSEVVVRLGTIDTVVTGFAKECRIGLEVIRNRITTPHILTTGTARVASKNHRIAGHRTNGRIRVGVAITDSLFCESVNIGGLSIIVAVAAYPVVTVILTGDPQNIGPFRF